MSQEEHPRICVACALPLVDTNLGVCTCHLCSDEIIHPQLVAHQEVSGFRCFLGDACRFLARLSSDSESDAGKPSLPHRKRLRIIAEANCEASHRLELRQCLARAQEALTLDTLSQGPRGVMQSASSYQEEEDGRGDMSGKVSTQEPAILEEKCRLEGD